MELAHLSLKNADLLVISKVLVGVLVLCMIGGTIQFYFSKIRKEIRTLEILIRMGDGGMFMKKWLFVILLGL